jgi:hypothetical protein
MIKQYVINLIKNDYDSKFLTYLAILIEAVQVMSFSFTF